MNSNVVWFFVILLTVTFFAPFFIGGRIRLSDIAKQNIERKVLKSMANRAYASYMIGVLLFVAGILGNLPFALSLFNAPGIIRFEEVHYATRVVIYNCIILTGQQFDIYFLISPLFLLAAALGMVRYEKSQRIMKEIDARLKDIP